MTIPRALAAAALLVLASATSASALFDVLMPCKTLSVKMDKLDPNAAVFKLVCLPTSGSFPLPNAANSPLENGLGASLYARDLVSSLATATLLPAPYWEGLGEPPGVEGYRYHDKANLGCRSIRLDSGRLKLNCKMLVPLGILPAAGDFGVLLHFYGDVSSNELDFCAQIGGSETRNDASVLKRKDAAEPTECVSP